LKSTSNAANSSENLTQSDPMKLNSGGGHRSALLYSRQLSTKSLMPKKALTGQDLAFAISACTGVGSARLRFSTSWQ
jgi:hypothetical protein